MSRTLSTFSGSWFRIANQKLSLRPDIQVRRQFFRGEKWFVLEDPFTNQYFRLSPVDYAFVARLRPDRTVQQVWEESIEQDPERSAGQEEIVKLISQLYFANLLHTDAPEESSRQFERYRKRKEREKQSRWLNILFFRITLFNPDALLNRLRPLIRVIYSPAGALVWFTTVLVALKLAIENFALLREQSQSVLDPNNLILLYLSFMGIKALHETGHAFACKRFGGEVPCIGMTLLIVTPVPFVDATASWSFPNRWHRILVGASGMIVEIFLASLATFVWASTGPGTLHSVAYNVMFVASVTTLIFNVNPLMRWDGYYILTDLLETPNLSQRATQALGANLERLLFGVKPEIQFGRRETIWLLVYAVLRMCYWIWVMFKIFLFTAARIPILGVFMTASAVVTFTVFPMVKFATYLAYNQRLADRRRRAVVMSAGLVLSLVVLIVLIPFPRKLKAPGIFEAQETAEVINETVGRVEALLAPSGSWVTNAQPLLRLSNRELELTIQSSRARCDKVQAYWRQAMLTNVADLKPLEQRLEEVHQEMRKLEQDAEHLVVRSRVDGLWSSPEVKDYVGRWLPRGSPLGMVLNPRAFYFTVTVRQTDVDQIFANGIRGATVRVRGQAGIPIRVRDFKIVPAALQNLPSAALGWFAGGEMPISLTEKSGRLSTEPFFEIKAEVEMSEKVRILHGRSGRIRFDLPPEPLLQQWYRRLRQLLQKEYQL